MSRRSARDRSNGCSLICRWTSAGASSTQRNATHLTDTEATALAGSGAVAGLCPVTEANLGDGIFPGVHYLDAGGRFGIGTDSNILIDAAAELRQLEYSQRLFQRSRNLLASEAVPSVGRRLFDAALIGGAQALGIRGGIAAGAPADIFTLDTDLPALVGAVDDTVLDSWIFASRVNCIDAVWRNGRRVVSGGRHHRSDEVTSRYRTVMTKLLG